MIKPSRWTLSARMTTLTAALAVALGLLAVAAAVVAVDNQHQTDVVFNKLSPLRTNADQLLIATINQETGIRGYALNHTPADLTPYTLGRRQEQDAVAQLTRLSADDPGLAARVRGLAEAIATWRAMVADPVIAKVQAGDPAGAQALIDDAARARMDTIRNGVAQLEAELAAKRVTAVGDVQDMNAQVVQLLIIAGAIVVLGGILLAVLMRMLVTRPIDQLAAEVDRVAGGDFTHEIDASGPPEVVALGSGVERMRQRIVADLDEVRGARQLAEQQSARLEAQAEELTRSNRDLEQFAYVASHDLQEPLRKVASFCQLLQRRYAGQLDERADQYISFAVDGAQRMQRLINDLLAFSRIGRMTNDFVEVDLSKVAAECVSQQQHALTSTEAEVTWSDLPVVRGEEALLTALIGNLISNSVKFRSPDEPPRISLSARQVDDQYEITCRDNGIGIAAEFADKVFVIFQRLHSKDAYPGTGIGLAIAKKIVEYHGGRIWVDQHDGPGTSIRFSLPVPAPATVEEPVAEETFA